MGGIENHFASHANVTSLHDDDLLRAYSVYSMADAVFGQKDPAKKRKGFQEILDAGLPVDVLIEAAIEHHDKTGIDFALQNGANYDTAEAYARQLAIEQAMTSSQPTGSSAAARLFKKMARGRQVHHDKAKDIADYMKHWKPEEPTFIHDLIHSD